jgi:hypothetical protein
VLYAGLAFLLEFALLLLLLLLLKLLEMLLLLRKKLLIELEEKVLNLLIEVRNIALIVKFYYAVGVHQLPSVWVDPSLRLLLFLQQFHALRLI